MNRVSLLLLLTSLLASTACPNLAQLAIGEGLRDDLIIGCCECLADSSSTDVSGRASFRKRAGLA